MLTSTKYDASRYLTFASFLVSYLLNVKVSLSLCLTKHDAMKVYWGSGGIAARILKLGTR
jgi:hypothetical protein